VRGHYQRLNLLPAEISLWKTLVLSLMTLHDNMGKGLDTVSKQKLYVALHDRKEWVTLSHVTAKNDPPPIIPALKHSGTSSS
jgi:hypothetical protein